MKNTIKNVLLAGLSISLVTVSIGYNNQRIQIEEMVERHRDMSEMLEGVLATNENLGMQLQEERNRPRTVCVRQGGGSLMDQIHNNIRDELGWC